MNPPAPNPGTLRGVAALFDANERKDLFRKYFHFLPWIELGVLLTCWLFQLGDSASYTHPFFPWRTYILLAFLSPVAITFLPGTIMTGFNKYFGQTQTGENELRPGTPAPKSGKVVQLGRMADLLGNLPYLGLLLLLGFGVILLYKLDSPGGMLEAIGAKSANVFLIFSGAILLLTASFALMLLIFHDKPRKMAIEYQFRSEVAEKFGLVILSDNTVLTIGTAKSTQLQPVDSVTPEIDYRDPG